jgi:hypothetical protein
MRTRRPRGLKVARASAFSAMSRIFGVESIKLLGRTGRELAEERLKEGVRGHPESSERLRAIERATASEPVDEAVLDVDDVDVLGKDAQLFMHGRALLRRTTCRARRRHRSARRRAC